jgi:hypothetical protein
MRTSADEVMVLLLLGGGTLIGLIAVVGGFLYARRERLLTHAERMKALELGREAPDAATRRGQTGPGEGKSHAARCFAATGNACFWGFLFAVGAAAKEGGNAPGAAYAIAAAAGAVGVTGLICGTVLASKAPAAPGPPGKPRLDPDAL